ncbi:MAG: hypothetical protein GY810_29895 [Aureispira sp.]|nr:hypothetical protein [Aureispira sp.]
MKKMPKLFLLATLLIGISACTSSINDKLVKEYDKSLKFFNQEKTDHIAYEFTLSTSSVMSGYSTSTTFLVQDGNILKRSFKEMSTDWETNEQVESNSWEERGADVGMNYSAHEVITLEQIYRRIPNLIKVDTNQNYVYFDAAHKGVVSIGGYFPRDCADDCFEGYNIQNFRWVDNLQSALSPSIANNQAEVTIVNPGMDRKYQESLEFFMSEKLNYRGYKFTLDFESAEGRNGHSTSFTVKNGRVVSRAYKGFRYDWNIEEQVEDESWTETGANIGLKNQGFPPISIEQIYKVIPTLIQRDSLENYIYLETKHNGVLSMGGFVDKNCADDCFEGYNISAFEWIE